MNRLSISTMKFASAVVAVAMILAIAAPVMAQNGPRGNGPGAGMNANVAPLTAAEAEWLTHMREEEKLARDVYQEMYKKWNLIIFSNISEAEEKHANAVAGKLARYGIADPAEGLPPGVYASTKLSDLYTALMEVGTRSIEDALQVGVLIEETDIDDLELAIAATDKTDIKRVYTNLLAGSLNHLEAFQSTHEAVCIATQAN